MLFITLAILDKTNVWKPQTDEILNLEKYVMFYKLKNKLTNILATIQY